jgi:hypothetical protein
MSSIKYSILIFSCISEASISFSLLPPYAIGNSITLNENHPIQTDLSKYDFNEDEFTGDAVPILDKNDVHYYYP